MSINIYILFLKTSRGPLDLELNVKWKLSNIDTITRQFEAICEQISRYYGRYPGVAPNVNIGEPFNISFKATPGDPSIPHPMNQVNKTIILFTE